MKHSLQICRISGIKISVHWTFIILIAWLLILNIKHQKDAADFLFTLGFILTLFVCIILHELAHALVAKRFGVKTKGITLLPIGGVAMMDEIPEKPKQELLIALAGPLVNIVIALGLFLIMKGFNLTPDITDLFQIREERFLMLLFASNVVLALFNFIPAFPMDGGRVLRAILSFRMDYDKATRIAAITGQIVAFGFVGIGIFYNPFLVFIGIFVYLGAQMETEYVHSKHLLKEYKVKDIMMHHFHTLHIGNTISDAVKLLLDVQGKDFIITEKRRAVGILSRNQLIKALSEKEEYALVTHIMNSNFLTLDPQMPLDIAFEKIRKQETSISPVISEGKLVGTVDMENILELILVKGAKQQYALKHQQEEKPKLATA